MSYRDSTDSAVCNAFCWHPSISLDPSGIRTARNRRIKESSRKLVEVSWGQSDFCLELTVLDQSTPAV